MIAEQVLILSRVVCNNRAAEGTATHHGRCRNHVVALLPLLCFSLNAFCESAKTEAPAAILERNASQAVLAREPEKAADLYDRAGHAFGQDGDLIKQAECLVESGKLRIDLQQYAEAYERFVRAADLYEKAPDASASSVALNQCQIGRVLFILEGPREALEKLHEVLAQLRDQEGLQRERAVCLWIIATIKNVLQQHEDAGAYAQEGALAAMEAAAFLEQANCTIQYFSAMVGLGRYEEALLACEQAHSLYKKEDNTHLEQVHCLLLMGNLLYGLGRTEQALAQYDKALLLPAEAPGVKPVLALCTMNAGVALNDLRRYKEAFTHLQEALEIFTSLEDSELNQAQCLFSLGNAAHGLGWHEEALENYEAALKLSRTIPNMHRDQANCLYNIGGVLDDLGRHKEAMDNYKAALDHYRTIPSTEADQADCLYNMGFTWRRMDDYAEALDSYKAALELYRTVPNTEQDQADCFYNMGIVLRRLNRYSDSLESYEAALELYRTVPNTEQDQADCLNAMGIVLAGLERYTEALEQHEGALRVCLGIANTEERQADSLNKMGFIYRKLENYVVSFEHYEAALELYRTQPDTEKDQAACLYATGIVLADLERYEEALERHEAALKLVATIPDTDEQMQAGLLQTMGNSLHQLGLLDTALKKLEEAHLLYGQLEEAERSQAETLAHAGWILIDMGRYEEALTIHNESYELFASLKGAEEHQARSLLGLGSAYTGLGRFVEALASYNKARTIFSSLEGFEGDHAESITHISAVQSLLGRHEESLSTIEEANQLLTSLDGAEILQANSLMRKGGVLWGLDRTEEALSCYQEAQKIFSSLNGTEWQQVDCLLNMYFVFKSLDLPDKAHASFEEANRLYAAIDVTTPVNRTLYAMRSGMILQGLGRFEEALSAHNEAAELLASRPDIDMQHILHDFAMGWAYGALDDWQNAMECGYRGFRRMWKAIIPNLPALTETQKNELSTRLLYPDFTFTISLLKDKTLSDAGRYGLDTALLRKGLIEHAMRQEQAVFAEHAPPEWQQQYDELQRWRREKAALAHTLHDDLRKLGVQEKQRPDLPDVRIQRLEELDARIIAREQDLAERNRAFAVEMRLQAVDSDMVSESLSFLGEETALLEYVKYDEWDLTKQRPLESRYGVYVLRSGADTPIGIDLGPAAAIDKAVNDFRNAVEHLPSLMGREGALPAPEVLKKMAKECAEAGNALRELVFDPVLPYLSGCTRLFVAPDAELFLFPFDALPSPDQGDVDLRYLIEDYDIVYLNAGRELVRFALRTPKGPANNAAVIVSDPALRMSAADQAKRTAQWLEARASDTPTTVVAHKHVPRDIPADAGLQYTTLGATERETLSEILESLQQIRGASRFSQSVLESLRNSGEYDYLTLYEQEDALEVRVQSLESPRLLQILAHGVFLPIEEEVETDSPYMILNDISRREIQNPLLRSMLALAGASVSTSERIYRVDDRYFTEEDWLAFGGAEDDHAHDILSLDDGLLTAYEVTGMRLYDTEMVALTACSTAVGEVGAGASVAGLRRAFIAAGAHSMIMSQWDVPERSSLSLMQHFYDSWLGEGTGRYTAFRESQLRILNSAREDVQGHPWFWAGFVYIGDPGELADLTDLD